MTSPFEVFGRCPRLIGRSTELERLVRSIAQAAAGNGHMLLLAGEAGVGKSRLASELKVLARQHAFQVLHGCCFEPDVLLPYAPLLDLLRSYLAAGVATEPPASLGPLDPYLPQLLPEFAAHASGLPALPLLEPGEQRRRLMQAFVQFFLAQTAPLLVIVEDLHWCDAASLETLLALARRSAGRPLLLLGSYRDDELQPPLAQLLASLERERLSVELRPQRLSYDETDAMLRAIFAQQHPIRSDFLREIYDLTEGNPFFIEEVMSALIARGAIYYEHGQWDRKPLSELDIPRSIQTAIQQRAERLSPEAYSLLTLAAVAGRRCDFTVLQRVTNASEAALLRWLKELIAAQLIVEEADDIFAFRHALTRHALYAHVLLRERRALHRALAQALATLLQERDAAAPEHWLTDLALHAFAAQDWPAALSYARRAADKAQLYAPRAAIEHLTHAITAAERLALTPDPTLVYSRGHMYETVGDFAHAQADYQTAIEQARASGDRPSEWRALLDLGFLWAERDYLRMREYRQQALDLARTLNDPRSLAQSLNRVGNWYVFIEQPQEARRYHQEALALFERADDQIGLAATYDLLGITAFIGGDISAGIPAYEQAIALFRSLGDMRGLASSLMYFASRGANLLCTAAAWPQVSAAECMRDGEEALRLAQQIGWRAGEAAALVLMAYSASPRGDYARALGYAKHALAISQDIEQTAWNVSAQCAYGATLCDLLAVDQARRVLEQALDQAQDLGTFFLRNVAGLLATTCIVQRDLGRARDVLALALPPETPMQTQGQRLCWAAAAELALAQHEPAAALAIAERLIAAAGAAPRSIPRACSLRAEALAALGRVDEAAEALQAGIQGAQERELGPLLWRLHASLGKLAQRRARRKQAAAAFAQARTLIAALAGGIPEPDLREGFLRQALAQLPRAVPSGARRRAKTTFDGLTAREREIATQIAQGRINREIAEKLVIGERTVETHISNILSKLAFHSRRQIAAWAVEKGLAKRIEEA